MVPAEKQRAKGRPKTGRKDCVSQDVRTFGGCNCTILAMDKDGWKEILRKNRAHNKLSCQYVGDDHDRF
ncbi:hypothetical protein C0J52_17316 [Blattella germanica]|nr:hypothetical protein C0J52_17316 [Blattella germanica]